MVFISTGTRGLSRSVYTSLTLLVAGVGFCQFPGISQMDLTPGIGDFEANWLGNGTGEGWDLWYQTENSPFTLSLDEQNAHTGLRSQRIDISKAEGAPAAGINLNQQQDLANAGGVARPGEHWQISYFMKTSPDISGTSLQVWVEYGKDDLVLGRVIYQPKTLIPVIGDWTRYSVDFTIPHDIFDPNRYNWFRFVFGVYTDLPEANGAIWIDSVSMINGQPFPNIIQKPMRTYCLYPYYVNQNWLYNATRWDGGRWELYDYTSLYDTVRPDAINSKFNRISYALTTNTTVGPDDLFPYNWLVDNHPEWILSYVDVNDNNRVKPITDGRYVALDIGNPELQQEIINRYVPIVQSGRFNYVLWDSFDLHVSHNFMNRVPVQYTLPDGSGDQARWEAATSSFLSNVAGAIRAAGPKVIINFAHCQTTEEPLKTWIESLDGILIELGFEVIGSDGNVWNYSFPSWKNKFLSMALAPSDKIVIVRSDGGLDTKMRRFGIASFLAGMQRNSYFSLCSHWEYVMWHPDLEVTIGNTPQDEIGQPVGDFVIVQGNLIDGCLVKRVFSNGLVLVNPKSSGSFTYTLPAAYRDLDGRVVPAGAITVEPRSGVILIGANPEDGDPPGGDVTNPPAGTNQKGLIPVTADHSDVNGISKVELYVDGQFISRKFDPPYNFVWNSREFDNGEHMISTRAVDAFNNEYLSDPVNVNLDNEFVPPVVTVTAPAHNSSALGVITLRANATDNDAVTRVEFYSGENLIGTVNSAPWNLGWDTRYWDTRAHLITARAYDPSNNVGYSEPITLNLTNRRMTGRVTISGYANMNGLRVNLSWRTPGTTTQVWSRSVNLDAAGRYICQVTPGMYDVWARVANTLGAVVRNINLNGDAVVDLTLVAGDANYDNIIDDADLTSVILDYGGAPTNLNGKTDLNGDGTVNDADITIVVLNYGLTGSP